MVVAAAAVTAVALAVAVGIVGETRVSAVIEKGENEGGSGSGSDATRPSYYSCARVFSVMLAKSVSVPSPCYRVGMLKIPFILPKVQVAGNSLDPTKSEWADYAAVQAERGNLSGNEVTRN